MNSLNVDLNVDFRYSDQSGYKWSVKVTQSVSDSLWPHGLYSPWNSPGQNTGVGSLSLLQGIFPTQESNPSLSHCRRILYQLSHTGNPRILERVAYPFSSRFSQPRNRTQVCLTAGGFFTSWVTREAQSDYNSKLNIFLTRFPINLKFINFYFCAKIQN